MEQLVIVKRLQEIEILTEKLGRRIRKIQEPLWATDEEGNFTRWSEWDKERSEIALTLIDAKLALIQTQRELIEQVITV